MHIWITDSSNTLKSFISVKEGKYLKITWFILIMANDDFVDSCHLHSF